MKTVMMKRIRMQIVVGGLLLLAAKGAMASCTFMDARFTASDSVALNLGHVVVQRDAPVGSVVATLSNNALGSRNDFIECTTSSFVTQWAAGGGGYTPVSYNAETLYQSGVMGLAFRIVTPGAGSTAGRYGTGALPRRVSNIPCRSSPTWWRLCGGSWGNYQLQLVKIAPVTGSGPITTGAISQALVSGQTQVMNYTLASGTVQTVACSVTNSNIIVNMGRTKNTEFSGAGSTAGDVAFAINLNCDAATNINLTLEPGSAGAADASHGVLNIDPADAGQTASGVGVQILHNDIPVALGEMLKIATTRTDGIFAIALKARYYQTRSDITPGRANANATFTTTYQ